jgi:hypothetical protein
VHKLSEVTNAAIGEVMAAKEAEEAKKEEATKKAAAAKLAKTSKAPGRQPARAVKTPLSAAGGWPELLKTLASGEKTVKSEAKKEKELQALKDSLRRAEEKAQEELDKRAAIEEQLTIANSNNAKLAAEQAATLKESADVYFHGLMRAFYLEVAPL